MIVEVVVTSAFPSVFLLLSLAGFVRRPVSGEARRRVVTAYQTQRRFLLLITEGDLELIREGANLAAMLIEKMEALMLGRADDI